MCTPLVRTHADVAKSVQVPASKEFTVLIYQHMHVIDSICRVSM